MNTPIIDSFIFRFFPCSFSFYISSYDFLIPQLQFPCPIDDIDNASEKFHKILKIISNATFKRLYIID